MEQYRRDFKGVWIRKELWLNRDLSLVEKCLLVEIDSLDNDNERGCFASNQYFASFFDLSEGRVANIISDLKKRGYLFQCYFDGRNRGLRINENFSKKSDSSVHENVKADLTNSLNQASRKSEHNNISINTSNNSLKNKEAENFENKFLEGERPHYAQTFIFTSPKEMRDYFEKNIRATIEQMEMKYTANKVQARIKEFCDSNFQIGYQSENELKRHFTNFIKKQDVPKAQSTHNGKIQQNNNISTKQSDSTLSFTKNKDVSLEEWNKQKEEAAKNTFKISKEDFDYADKHGKFPPHLDFLNKHL